MLNNMFILSSNRLHLINGKFRRILKTEDNSIRKEISSVMKEGDDNIP